MNEKELLKSMEYLYLLLENGLMKPSFDIIEDAQIDSKTWHKLMQGEIIERTGSARFPVYKWVAGQPDSAMATEILKEYPELIRDLIFPNENRSNSELVKKREINIPFSTFWNAYDKKTDRFICEKQWGKLTDKERNLCMLSLPEYIKSTPNKIYRKNPFKYLLNKSWENEIIKTEPLKNETMVYEKDQLFNWTVPEVGTSGRKITTDLRVNFKHNAIYVGYSFLDSNFPNIDKNNMHIAFVNLDGEGKAYMVVSPNKGIPFFILKAKDGIKHKSPSIGCKSLAMLIKAKFSITKDLVVDFKLQKFQQFNGMMFYELIRE